MTKARFVAAFAMLFAVASAAQGQSDPRVYTPQFGDPADNDVPYVQVWLQGQSFDYGDVIRPYVTTDPGAYLTIVRVTTDGNLQVLYPYEPRDQAPYNPARFSNDRVPMTRSSGFFVRESAGRGFIFAIASHYRFNFSYYSSRGLWSTTRLASASRFGSPFQIMRSFVEEITEGSSSYSMDYVMYDVDGRYRSRYASRFRNYAYGDYYDLCLSAFDRYYYSYCGGYRGYYNPYIVVRGPSHPVPPKGKSMRPGGRPLVHDPVLPHADQPAIGHFPTPEPNQARDAARRERMLRDARPRVEPQIESRSAPRVDRPPSQPSASQPVQRSEPRALPRAEPRAEPRVEHRRVEPPPRRIDAPREQPQNRPARVDAPPKDNQ
jgi:hypothetical protein